MSKIARQLSSRKRRIKRRVKKTNDNKYRRFAEGAGPVIDVGAVQYELADKVRGVANGGVGLMLRGCLRDIVVVVLDRDGGGSSIQSLRQFVPEFLDLPGQQFQIPGIGPCVRSLAGSRFRTNTTRQRVVRDAEIGATRWRVVLAIDL